MKLKKVIIMLLIVVITILLSTTVQATIFLGDVNQDGKVNSEDSRIILRFSVGLDEPEGIEKRLADMDEDGKITSADARLALRTSVGSENLKAFNNWYTKSLKAGDYLEFTGYSWIIYGTKANAENKTQSIDSLKNGNVIKINKIYNNVLQIGANRYIYYGESGQYFFEKLKAPTGISVNPTNANLNVNNTLTVKMTITPRDANKKVKWTSSNSNIASVDENGIVKGIKESSNPVTITATTFNGKTATCKITVKNPIPPQLVGKNTSGINVSNDVLKIITHNGKYTFTRSDYEYFVRTMYAEAGGTTGSNIMMKMCAATIINIMEQDSYSGKGKITDVLKRTCVVIPRGMLKTFNESKSAEGPVKAALAGEDPTDEIKNGFGGKGAVSFMAYGSQNKNQDETIKRFKDSSGNVICIKNKNVYFKSRYDLNVSRFK